MGFKASLAAAPLLSTTAISTFAYVESTKPYIVTDTPPVVDVTRNPNCGVKNAHERGENRA